MAARKSGTTGFVADESTEASESSLQTISLEAFKVEKYELQELGNKFPIGLFHPETGERLQDFVLNPYRTKLGYGNDSCKNEPFALKSLSCGASGFETT